MLTSIIWALHLKDDCSEWNDGRQALRLGHNASLPQIGGSATLSVTGNALGGGAVMF